MLKELYDRDYNLWIEEMKQRLVNRNFEGMDWDNLAEEIEDMGASQKRALRSYYFRLVEHILKLRDWDAERDRNTPKWRGSVSNFRSQINCILDDSPSLKNYLEANHTIWFDKVTNNFSKSKLFTVKDKKAIALSTMMNEDYFGA